MLDLVLGRALEILGRLCLTGPLLYIGLLMVVEPANFVRITEMFTTAVRNFERHLSKARIWEPLDQPAPLCVTAKVRFVVRLFGLCFSAIAIAFFVAA